MDTSITRFKPSEQVIYFAHPFGGKDKNVEMAGYLAEKLGSMFPKVAIFSPIHNWGYLKYAEASQFCVINDCLAMLGRCDCLVLGGDWLTSCGCCAEYAYAKAAGKAIYEWDGNNLSLLVTAKSEVLRNGD